MQTKIQAVHCPHWHSRQRLVNARVKSPPILKIMLIVLSFVLCKI